MADAPGPSARERNWKLVAALGLHAAASGSVAGFCKKQTGRLPTADYIIELIRDRG